MLVTDVSNIEILFVICHQHRDVINKIVENHILQFKKDNALQASFPPALILNATDKDLAT